MSGYWLKLYTEILDDPKYFRLSDNAKLGMIELMVVAKRVNMDGRLPTPEDVSFYTRRNKEWWDAVYVELIDIEFIEHDDDGDIIRKFSERQAPVPATERSRQHRIVKHSCNDNATLSHGDTEADTDTELDTEEKQNNNAPLSYTKFLPSGQFSEKVFITLTGMVTFPAKDADTAINAIESLRSKYPTVPDMIEYLKPFYTDWLRRNYSKTNLAWLTDWAVTGEIPKAKSKEEPMSRQQKLLKKLKDM
jgi:hypothetical protein